MRRSLAALLLGLAVLAPACSDGGGGDGGGDGGGGDGEVSLPEDLCPVAVGAVDEDWGLEEDRARDEGERCVVSTTGDAGTTALTVTWVAGGTDAAAVLAETCDFLFQADVEGDWCQADAPGKVSRAFLAADGVVAVSLYSEGDAHPAGDLDGQIDQVQDALTE